jgi:hypothetical protein
MARRQHEERLAEGVRIRQMKASRSENMARTAAFIDRRAQTNPRNCSGPTADATSAIPLSPSNGAIAQMIPQLSPGSHESIDYEPDEGLRGVERTVAVLSAILLSVANVRQKFR